MLSVINSLIFRIIRYILLKRGYFGIDGDAKTSFSQMGEDRILSAIFAKKKNGFYVDVGAYHPKLYSNTYLLYLQGWNGINIDPMPNSMKLFDKVRPRDINLEIAIAKENKKMEYYIFNEPALNGFSKNISKSRHAKGHYKIIRKTNIVTHSLSGILKKYVTGDRAIDLLNVDVEGLDLSVLQSNDWEKFVPKVIVVEDLELTLENLRKSQIYKFLHKKQYIFYAKTNISSLLIHRNFINSL